MSFTIAEIKNINEVVGRIFDGLSVTIPSVAGSSGSDLRRQIGDLRAFAIDKLEDQTFSTELLNCFTAARLAGASRQSFEMLRQKLFAEVFTGPVTASIIYAAIVYCLGAESRLITAIIFKSRDDVDIMMKKMSAAFKTACDTAADEMDPQSYQTISASYAALMQFLSTTARPLPRMMKFELPLPFPALTAAMKMYQDPSRWEEIVGENHVVHPAFLPRQLVGLSA